MSNRKPPWSTVEVPIRFVSLVRVGLDVVYTAALFPEGEPAHAVSGELNITSRQGTLTVDDLAESVMRL